MSLKLEEINSQALAAHIVAYKSLGINKDFAIQCMAELGKRRAAGDDFDFEKFIEDELAKIPKLKDINYQNILNNINSLKKQIK